MSGTVFSLTLNLGRIMPQETAAVLYLNSDGKAVTHSSYSSRQVFKHCPRQFFHERVQGWSDKSKRAAPLFGRCIEAGVQAWHENGECHITAALGTFERLWNDVKNLPEFPQLEFTASEKNWESLLRAGREMMLLYGIRIQHLPIVNPIFQQTIRKTIFPGTHLAALENKAIFDMISFPAWDHPLLPKLLNGEDMPTPKYHRMSDFLPGGGVQRPLIIDIKTSGMALDLELISLDPQLGEYAWMARIPDVAFLWFVKHGHDCRKGSRVTLLQDVDGRKAGQALIVLSGGGKEEEGILYLSDQQDFDAYEQAINGLRGKAADAAKSDFMQSKFVARCPASAVTKQQLQFGAARLTDQQVDEIGKDVAQTTVEMLRCSTEGYYPKLAGVRFPNQKCNFCAMRYICLNKPEQRDQLLTRRGEEWLDAESEE